MGCEKEEPPVIATEIQASPESVNLNAGEQATVEIKTVPGGIAHWTIFDKPDWLTIAPMEGSIYTTEASTITLTTNDEGLEPATYTGKIVVASTAGQDTVEVRLFIEADPQAGLSASELSFPDGLNQNELQITNEGLGALNYTLSSDISWMTIAPENGSLGTGESNAITFSVDRTYIVAGTYTGEVRVSSNAAHGDKMIPVTIEVPEIATITTDADTIGFNYFVDDLQLTIQNDGNVTYDYTITSQNNLLIFSQSSGSLEMSQTTTVALTPVRDGLGTGVFTDVLTIANNKGESVEVKVGLLNYVEEKWLLDVQVKDAEYAHNRDVIVAISNQALHLIDPVAKTYRTLALTKAATSLSVSPDGNFVAVGHDGAISYIDITTFTLVNTFAVNTVVFDVVLPGNGYAYVFPEQGTYNTHVYSVTLRNGNTTITGGSSYYTKAKAKLHPGGSYIYTVTQGSPSKITKYDISKGNASFLYASGTPYNFDSNLWFSTSGDHLFARSADILQPSTDPATDLVPVAKLDQSEKVVTLDHAAAAGKVYAILTSEDDPTYVPAPEVKVYGGTTFGFEKTIPLPKYLLADGNGGGELVNALGYFGFFNNTGTEFYVITLDAENKSSQAIITIPVN